MNIFDDMNIFNFKIIYFYLILEYHVVKLVIYIIIIYKLIIREIYRYLLLKSTYFGNSCICTYNY